MIFTVKIIAPQINEEVVTEADSEAQAKERAVYSALQRQFKAAEVTVTLPEPPAAA
jgi:hypothetical protein